jgi:hypothetical protein
MDERTNGVGALERPEDAEKPEEKAERLEQRAEALRENLNGLVDELDHRRHGVRWRLVKPAAVAVALGVVVLGAFGVILWRRARRAWRLAR